MVEVPQLVLDEGCCSSSRRGWAGLGFGVHQSAG